MERRAAGDPRRRAEHGAGAPPRRRRRAALDAGRADARRRRAGGMVSRASSLTADRRLCVAGARRPLQMVGAHLGHRRAAVAADLRRRPARKRACRTRRRELDVALAQLPRAGAGRVQGCRGPARGAARCSPSSPQAQTARGRRRRRARPRCRTSRYRNGFVSQLELLDAQRSELRNRRQALQVQVGAVPGDGRTDPRARRRMGCVSQPAVVAKPEGRCESSSAFASRRSVNWKPSVNQP